jgi:4-diphosphocytidyl-2-C-methyl-D-erythritol kinase
MQSVGLFDTVSIERCDGITVGCSDARLCGSGNLAYRAAELFFEAAGVGAGAKIQIAKRIPVAAGLAGGSADAAAVIVGLDALFGTAFGTDRLCAIGLSAGADVPFCIAGGTMLACGIGEKLSPAPPLPDCRVVIAKAGEKSSTGGLYALYDKSCAKKRPDTRAMLGALTSGSLAAVGAGLCNAFEELVPQSLLIKRKMLGCGALGASLSGSGPAVFGIFDDERKAGECFNAIGVSAQICAPTRHGCEII